ncbi:MAG TPA: MFS transporter, partial [Acidimicrobiales bacterium]|nr:MFS transporter [Acidimicrobiales bacterium]
SGTGQTLGTVAVAVVVYSRTHSNAWVAAAATSRLLPYVLFSAAGGVVADRLGWVRTLKLSSLGRAVLTAGLAVGAAAGAPAAVMVGLAFAAAAVGTPCYPAVAATTPALVPTEDLVPANGLLTTVESTAFMLGPAIGGAVLSVADPTATFVVNVVVLLAAFVVFRPLGDVAPSPRPPEGESLWQAGRAGVRAAASTPDAAAPLLFVMAANLVYGVALVALIPAAAQLLHAGREGYGYLNGALGAGALAGVLVANRLARTHRPHAAIGAAAVLTSVPFVVLAGTGSLWPAAALMVVSGAAGVVTEVLAVTVLQRVVAPELLARIFGIFDALAVGSILAGSVVTPLLLSTLGITGTLAAVGIGVPAAAVLGSRPLLAAARRGEAWRARTDPVVDLLEGLPVLHGAGRVALQALAGAATEERVAAGQEVVVQGDGPDDFFAIRHGRFTVWQDGQELRVLGPGDGFGEIGLLEGVPRTATVRALEPGVVLRVRGEDFVAAVIGWRAGLASP